MDAKTGEPVPRTTIYVHFFSDEANLQTTLNPSSDATFELLMPTPKVRVRVYDQERTYALYERTLTLSSRKESLEIKLEPTHFIRLHGRVLDAATGKPIAPPANGGNAVGDRVLFYFQHGGVPAHPGTIGADDGGRYALKVPRGVIKILAVNTPKKIKVDTVDLTGKTDDAFEFDIELH